MPSVTTARSSESTVFSHYQVARCNFCQPSLGWFRWLASLLLFCMCSIWGNSAQAQVFSTLEGKSGTVTAPATTFNAGIKGYVQVGQVGDAINAVQLYREGNTTPLASQYYTVSYTKYETAIDTKRYFDLSAALPPGTYRLYVSAESENGLSANSPVFTVTVALDQSTIAAVMDVVFSLLFDDDNSSSTTPPNGGTGDTGGAGGAGGTGGGSSTGGSGGSTPLTLTSVSISHLSKPDAGTLPGALTVGKDGTASYGISLGVPPGTAGMQPSLALNYNSGAGMGIAGLGWTLGGGSSIHRCAKTMAQDGVNDRITFTSSDRLCLDGNRLMRVNGGDVGSDFGALDAAYWDYTAVYRTELESFSRVTRFAAGFKVENKDGTVQYYGITGDSAPQAQGRADGKPVQWMLSRLEDRSGNYLTWEYNYDPTSGGVTPNQVRYGGNAVNGQSADLAVRFSYEARPDVQIAFMGGSHTDISTRLTKVSTYIGTLTDGTGGNLVRQYQLNYKTSSASGRSLVQSIQASGANPLTGVLEFMPPTVFEWADSASLPQIVRGAAFTLPDFGDPSQGYRSPMNQFVTLDGTGRVSSVAVKMSACGKTGEPNCVGQDVALHATGLLRVRSPEGVDSDVTVDFSPLFSSALPTDLRFAGGMVGPTGVEFVDVDGDGRDDMVLTDTWNNSLTWGKAPIRWGVCMNSGAIGAPLMFRCIPGAAFSPAFVELQSDRKMHMVSPFDSQGNGSDCFFSKETSAIACKPIKLTSDVPLPLALNPYNVYNFFRPEGLRLGRRSMTDLYSVWNAEVPAADPNNPYNTKYYLNQSNNTVERKPIDVVQGVTVCVNRPDGLKCQELARVRSSGKLLTELVPSIVDDLNGDGLMDFVYQIKAPKQLYAANTGPGTMYVCLSKETGVDCKASSKQFSLNADKTDPLDTARSGDYLGDGVVQVIFNKVPSSPNATGAKSELCRYSSGGFVCQEMPYLASQSDPSKQGVLGEGPMDESGVPKLTAMELNLTSTSVRPVFTPISLTALADQDKLTRVTNGVGHVSGASFARGDDSNVYKRYSLGGALPMPVYPKVVSAPGVMAKEVRLANGKGGWLRSAYFYEGATVDVAGRDPFNFASFRVTDVQNQVSTTSLLALDFPFAGEVRERQTVFNSSVLLNKIHVDFNQKPLVFSSGARTAFPFAETTLNIRNDLDGTAISQSTSVDGFDNWGNRTTRNENVSGAGATFTSSSVISFDNDEANWLLGLAKTVVVTKGATGVPNVTQTMAYEYDSKGRLKTETTEPNIPSLTVEVIHSRENNSFGLVNTSTQKWIDPNTGAAQQRKIKDVEFDVKGRFLFKSRNALGHEEVRNYFAGTGSLSDVTDANQLKSTWTVDGFGRVKTATGPDGNEIRSYVKQCMGTCPLAAATVIVTDTFNGTNRIAMPTMYFSDVAGHVLRKLSYGFDGREINTDLRYDDQGREWQVDLPRFVGESAHLSYAKRYDELGRLKEIEGRDDAGVPIFTRYSYRGLVIDNENAKAKVESQIRDVLGRLVQVKDREGGLTEMRYDALGNLLSTSDPNRNVVSIEYDLLGHRIALNDPDLGRTKYEVDPVGRTWKQTSAKQALINQTAPVKEFARFEFDLLDRMTGRYEPDLESHWQYDVAAFGKGRLAEAYTIAGGLKDYQRIQSYDNKGRLTTVKQFIDNGRYTYTSEYDGWGRIAKQSYLQNDDNATLRAFDLRYNDKGYLNRIEKSGRALWVATAQDALGQIAVASLGNNLVETTQYKAATYRLDSHDVRLNGILKVNENYQYDVVGNVSRREQYWASQQFSESFGYDNLNRLTSSQIGSESKIFAYDQAGNVRSKTGVGNGDYVYPTQGEGAIRPHAVQSIPGIGSFVYDDNGNLTSGGGRMMEWTSFDMPMLVKKGTIWSSFVYGPEHQRTIQRRSDGSRIVYAGGQELERTDTTTTVRTYWPNNIGVEIVRPNGSVEENWFHMDRMGSIIAISDKDGVIKESLSYDPWGKRRTLDGSSTPDSLDGVIDHKGYTGHEMLDQLDLVHMNGRLFDPLLGRFVSADPHVTNPFDGQSYGRYTYVFNNPLGYTDPTGFDGFSVTVPGQADFNTAPNMASGGGMGGAFAFREAMAPVRSYWNISLRPGLLRTASSLMHLAADNIPVYSNVMAAKESAENGQLGMVMLYGGLAVVDGLTVGESTVVEGVLKGGAKELAVAGSKNAFEVAVPKVVVAAKKAEQVAEPAMPSVTRFVSGVKVVDKKTGAVFQGTVDLGPTLQRIKDGVRHPHPNDGSVFRNKPNPGKTTSELPVHPEGYYNEYVVPTPGISGPGPQRIVTGQGGEKYYTPDHYLTFIPLNK